MRQDLEEAIGHKDEIYKIMESTEINQDRTLERQLKETNAVIRELESEIERLEHTVSE